MGNVTLKTNGAYQHFKTTPEIRRNYSDAEKRKLANASKNFESLMTGMMIKSMTKTTDGLFGKDNYGGDILDTVFENELAKYITDSKSVGIADMLYKKLTGENIEDIPKNDNGKLKIPKIEFDKTTPAIVPADKSLNKLNKYQDIINEAAGKYGVNEKLIKSIILTESAGNERAVSKANAKGLMQLMDSTATDMGVRDVMDPKENIFGGTKYFAKMLRQYNGDVNLALAAYNAGPGNVDKYSGVPPFDETKNYINRVLGYLNHLES